MLLDEQIVGRRWGLLSRGLVNIDGSLIVFPFTSLGSIDFHETALAPSTNLALYIDTSTVSLDDYAALGIGTCLSKKYWKLERGRMSKKERLQVLIH